MFNEKLQRIYCKTLTKISGVEVTCNWAPPGTLKRCLLFSLHISGTTEGAPISVLFLLEGLLLILASVVKPTGLSLESVEDSGFSSRCEVRYGSMCSQSKQSDIILPFFKCVPIFHTSGTSVCGHYTVHTGI